MPRNEAGRYRHIEVQPVAGALGAEIDGVNAAARSTTRSSRRSARPSSITW